MIAILSPSKTLKESPIKFDIKITTPKFEKDANYLIGELKKYSIENLMTLMKISDKLAEINFIRYKTFKKLEKYPCGFLFKGDVYRGLDIDTLDKKEFDYLNDHILILSGLYGYLHFSDEIRPYRLEMGIPLANKKGKNLYDYWDNRIYNSIVKEKKPDIIINLASKEYSKALRLKNTKVLVVDVEFLQKRKGKYQQIALFSKVARGLMARFMSKNKIVSLEELKEFDYDGYEYNKDLSNMTKLVFVR